MKERWSKRGPGETPLRAAVASADDIDDGEADDLRAFAVLKDDEREFKEYWDGEYRAPMGNE